MSKQGLTIASVVLAVVAAGLTWWLIKDIQAPVKFKKEQAMRYEVVKAKLEMIKSLQEAHREATGTYADNFDSLLFVINTDSFVEERKLLIPREMYDTAIHGLNPQLGDDTTQYLLIDTTLVAMKDSLLRNPNFPANEIHLIPFSDDKSFYVEVGSHRSKSGLKVPIYYVSAPNKHILNGLNKKFFNGNYGWELGSTYEPVTDIRPSKEEVYYEEKKKLNLEI